MGFGRGRFKEKIKTKIYLEEREPLRGAILWVRSTTLRSAQDDLRSAIGVLLIIIDIH